MGLLRRTARTAGRTALVTAVATNTHASVSQRQRGRAAEQTSQPPTPVTAPPDVTQRRIEQLRQLGELRDAGVLTPDEFDGQKAALLGTT